MNDGTQFNVIAIQSQTAAAPTGFVDLALPSGVVVRAQCGCLYTLRGWTCTSLGATSSDTPVRRLRLRNQQRRALMLNTWCSAHRKHPSQQHLRCSSSQHGRTMSSANSGRVPRSSTATATQSGLTRMVLAGRRFTAHQRQLHLLPCLWLQVRDEPEARLERTTGRPSLYSQTNGYTCTSIRVVSSREQHSRFTASLFGLSSNLPTEHPTQRARRYRRATSASRLARWVGKPQTI